MDRGRVVTAITGATRRGRAAAETARRTAETRTRVRLMIEITARAGAYRKGLLAAARHLSPEEAAIISDLERHGLQVPQLHDVLCGGHVIVDDPRLYESWRFDRISHQRLSSHHRNIDKARYPDIGMRGQVVREKLHGRTAQGTWVQLEKTPAAFGQRKLPSLNDVRHLMDYITYRITRSNVGPWGLSKWTERRPIYLSPDLAVPTGLAPPVADSLATALRRIEADDDVTAASGNLARRFAPPDRADPSRELGQTLTGRARPVRQLRGVDHRDPVPGRRGDSAAAPDRAAGRGAARATEVVVSDNDRAGRPPVPPGAGRGGPDPAAVPEGFVPAIVNLVNTGPVELGAYTVAELTAVDAIVDFLAARPPDAVLAEAVRSLAARKLLVAGSAAEQVEVRGDLGIAVAFQQRARLVLDARATGTEPGEPWRILLLPQPEQITMMVRIDALGLHEISLRKLNEALSMLADWLPRGREADPELGTDADGVLASAERSALVTVTRYTTQGSAEIAGASADLVLARRDGQLHAFSAGPDDDGKLQSGALDGNDVRDALAGMLS